MSEQKDPRNKDYDGKVKGDSFSVINRTQAFAAELFDASVGATKEYRFSLCKIIQTEACEAIHLTRQANECNLGSEDRERLQGEAIERVKRVDDLLPVIRRCRCISPKKEQELHKKLHNLKIAFNKWIASDIRRIKEKENA